MESQERIMNVFIMVLVFIFMAGYYFMDAPSQRIEKNEAEYVVSRADLRSVAECASAAQTAAIYDVEFNDICIEQYDIATDIICLNDRMMVGTCEVVRNRKPKASFVVTTTGILNPNDYNTMLEIIEVYFKDSGAFGVLYDGEIMTGGTRGRRPVPKAIVDELELNNGQLAYVTQFEIPDEPTEYATVAPPEIICPPGTIGVYRFGRWQCVDTNTKSSCNGDYIWDSNLAESIPDEKRRPMCVSNQTAIIIEYIWVCVDPFSNVTCPSGMLAQLNYSTLEWECVTDPSKISITKKCENIRRGASLGGGRIVPRVTNCNDCEKMVTDEDTCESWCVPDETKLNDPACYAQKSAAAFSIASATGCGGTSRAFYFGFPNANYASRVDKVAGYNIPFGTMYSQNRRFNCLDCGEGRIDTDKSLPPFIAICE